MYYNIQASIKLEACFNRPRSSSGVHCVRILETVLFKVTAWFLLQSVPSQSMLKLKVVKYMMGVILVTSLLLTSCYNSGLASSMTVLR